MPSSEDDVLRLSVEPGKGAMRLDRFLSESVVGMSRTRLQALITGGCVQVNDTVVYERKYKVRDDDSVHVTVPSSVPSELVAQDIPLDVIYEDADLIVIDKPVGLVVHPAPGNPDKTLVNALLAHCGDTLKGVGGVVRPGIVHRLDKGTSGLMVAAKSAEAHASLAGQFAAHTIKRAYKALVWGVPEKRQGTIEGNIGRNPQNRKKMAVVVRGGKHAITHYKVEQVFGDVVSLVECRLETGRTHQIRVHMAAQGHPLVGDPQYGGGGKRVRQLSPDIRAALQSTTHQILHACELGFAHPGTGNNMLWRVGPPGWFRDAIRLFDGL